MPEELKSPPENTPSAEEWIRSIFDSRQADIVTAKDFDISGAMAVAIAGNSVEEHFDEKNLDDEGVQTKNKLLAKLGELADDHALHVEDLLTLLDRQALELDDQPHETRYRQFTGLWDILVAVSKDEELMEYFKKTPHPGV